MVAARAWLLLLWGFKIDQGRTFHMFIALSPLERLCTRDLLQTQDVGLAPHCYSLLVSCASKYPSPDRDHPDH